MSSFDYARTAQTATRLLQRFGAATTLTRAGSPIYDPATSSASSTPTVVAIQAAVLPYEDRMVGGTSVLGTDQQCFAAAAGVAPPQPGDRVAWQGRALTVVRAKNLGPAGVFVLYELQLRAQ